MRYENVIMFVDGCAQPNPGPAGAGVIMKDEEGEVICTLSESLGTRTSNEAEYDALILGLEKVIRDYEVDNLVVYSDSQLLVKQINGEYRVKKPELAELKEQVDMLVEQLKGFRIEHVPREQNREADQLSMEAVLGKGARRPVGRYISTVDIERYCGQRCEVGKFGDEECTERGCHLHGFASEVLKP